MGTISIITVVMTPKLLFNFESWKTILILLHNKFASIVYVTQNLAYAFAFFNLHILPIDHIEF